MENFDQLFESALQFKTIEAPRNNLHKQVVKSRYQYQFNNWLVEVKGWNAGNEAEYLKLLTKENWRGFIAYLKEQETDKQKAHTAEAESWGIVQPPPPQIETKTEQVTIEIKPALKPEAVQIVFEILKGFFSTEQQSQLKQVLETGGNASTKLLFRGNGNRLTDTFKKLIEHDFITGCQKQDLINWIISNFSFTHRNNVKAFVYDTVEKTISRNYYPCKSPLIEVKNGLISKVEQPRTKKYNNH